MYRFIQRAELIWSPYPFSGTFSFQCITTIIMHRFNIIIVITFLMSNSRSSELCMSIFQRTSNRVTSSIDSSVVSAAASKGWESGIGILPSRVATFPTVTSKDLGHVGAIACALVGAVLFLACIVAVLAWRQRKIKKTMVIMAKQCD